MCGNYTVPAPEQVREILKLQMCNRSAITGKAIAFPRLHIMIYEQFPGVFEAACLEFSLFASGTSIDSAKLNMKVMCNNYLSTIIKVRKQAQQLFDDVSNTEMEGFWALYRMLNVVNAAQGKIDIDVSLVRSLLEENTRMCDRISELQDQLKVQGSDALHDDMMLFETNKIPISYQNRVASFFNAN